MLTQQQFAGGPPRQLAWFLALQIQISLRHPYPFTMFTRSSFSNGHWINTPGRLGGDLPGALRESIPSDLG
jgi:hypothetical protein